MDRKISFYDGLTYTAIFAVPIAPAFWFGWSSGTAVYSLVYAASENAALAAVLGGVVGLISAFGLETVGIVAGHVAVSSYERGDLRDAKIASAIMLGYVSLGISALLDLLDVGIVMFIIAPLVYVLAALQSQLKRRQALDERERQEEIRKQRAKDIERREREEIEREAREAAKAEARETRRMKREIEREFALEKLRLETETKLAAIELKAKAKEEPKAKAKEEPKAKAKETAVSFVSANGSNHDEDPAEMIRREIELNEKRPSSEKRTNVDIGHDFINPRTGKPYTGQAVGQIKKKLIKEI